MSASLLALLLSLALAGCASLPPQGQRPVSTALADTADTPLARIAAAAAPDDERQLSGFRPLMDGDHALNARIALIRRAQKSLDLQYYLIASDEVGLLLLRELRDAAARGVRVRVLVDDLYAAGQDELFAGLAAHANVELRLFNPLPARSGTFGARIVLSLHEFTRINRRMHNKLFIADNAFAIVGGRNLANEYFMRSESANFIDADVLATGPVVRELSTVFDAYWNSEQAWAVQSLTAGKPADARASFDAMVLIAAILGLIIAAPAARRFRLRHWVWTFMVAVAVVFFGMLLMQPFQRIHQRLEPMLRGGGRVPATGSPDPDSARGLPDQPPAGPSHRINR